MTAQAATAPGWRVAHTDHSQADDLLAIAVISPGNVWAGGAATNGPIRSRPIMEHWLGRRWQTVGLPGGLQGQIQVLRASSWRNVWAFGSDRAGTAYALRWDGRHWSVAKRWPPRQAVAPADATVFSPNDIWLFSSTSDRAQHAEAEHFDGHTWHNVSFPDMFRFDSASALGPQNIWAVGAGLAGEVSVAHGTVQAGILTWQVTAIAGLPVSHSGDLLTDINALSANDVWLFGGNVTAHGRWYPLAEHWSGATWSPARAAGAFTLQGGHSIADGARALWITTGWDSTGVPPHLLRFSGGGFTPVSVPRQGGRYVGVFGLAGIPGSAGAWAAGTLSAKGGLGPTSGVILNDGR